MPPHPRQLATAPHDVPPRGKWDPHCLEGQQYVDFVDTLREFERLTGLVEQQMLCAQLVSASMLRRNVAANHHFIDAAVNSSTTQG